LTLVPGHDVDLVNLHLALQFHRRRFGDQPSAQLLRHGLHVRDGQAQLIRDLPVGEVQAHEIQAQHPDPQRLMMAGQHRAGEVVEAGRARLASVTLTVRLRLIAPVPDH